jgi:hypothetical protein
VTLAFDEATHTYRVDGMVVPSVTQVLHRTLGIRHDPDPIYAARGTAVHEWIRDHFHDDETDPPDGITSYIERFRTFRDMLELQALAVEVRAFSPTLRICGTVDCIAVSQTTGVLWILDWKSGNAEPWHFLQVAGYRRLLQDCEIAGEVAQFSARSAQAAVVSLAAKTPRPRLVEERSAEVFEHAVHVYHWLHTYGGKNGNARG